MYIWSMQENFNFLWIESSVENALAKLLGIKAYKIHKSVMWRESTCEKPQGNSWFLASSVLCVKPQFVATSHQSAAIPTLAGVITRFPVGAPHVRSVSSP